MKKILGKSYNSETFFKWNGYVIGVVACWFMKNRHSRIEKYLTIRFMSYERNMST